MYTAYSVHNVVLGQVYRFTNFFKTIKKKQYKTYRGHFMNSEDRGRSNYLDLLITTLMEHEKNLDSLIERLEILYRNGKTIEVKTKGQYNA